jgi:exopolyphosphatase / guanosine-5'-triphosphate,3'-diphosphate pyrophosphatase
LKLLKFAAIDIGSNAVRLLFMNVIEEEGDVFFRKSQFVRMPVRLGEDAFYDPGKISESKKEKLLHTLLAFKHLITVQDVISYRTCATSAMREASNSEEIVSYIRDRSGIMIEVIDGQQEAELVYSNRIVEMIDTEKSYLYVDVGGGSTELTLFSKKEAIASGSFNIGTVRFLNGDVSNNELSRMKTFVTELAESYQPIELIGSGGNINKIFKLSGNKDGVPLTRKKFRKIYSYVESFTIEERIKFLGFTPDRADVIIPATRLYLGIMKWTRAARILIPKIGVADGIIHQLYNDYRRKTG